MRNLQMIGLDAALEEIGLRIVWGHKKIDKKLTFCSLLKSFKQLFLRGVTQVWL